jgi:hypothetical protein
MSNLIPDSLDVQSLFRMVLQQPTSSQPHTSNDLQGDWHQEMSRINKQTDNIDNGFDLMAITGCVTRQRLAGKNHDRPSCISQSFSIGVENIMTFLSPATCNYFSSSIPGAS